MPVFNFHTGHMADLGRLTGGFERRPGFDQGPIEAEMLIRKQARRFRRIHHPNEKFVRGTSGKKSLPIFDTIGASTNPGVDFSGRIENGVPGDSFLLPAHASFLELELRGFRRSGVARCPAMGPGYPGRHYFHQGGGGIKVIELPAMHNQGRNNADPVNAASATEPTITTQPSSPWTPPGARNR